MWQFVEFRSNSNCRLLPRKRFFDSHCLPFVLLAFIFFLTVEPTRSHDAKHIFKSSKKDSNSDKILCRRCGAQLANAKDIINHLSPEAKVFTNQTLFEQKGVEVQVLNNAFNIQFQVISVANAQDCIPVEKWYSSESWYPGYAWRPCICKKCRTHHGWVFEPVEIAQLNAHVLSKRAFYLVKLHNTVSEKFTESLLVVPYSNIR